LRVARKSGAHEAVLARISRQFPTEAKEIASSFDKLEERQARRWVDRLARAFALTLLAENGKSDALDRQLLPR
jgi:hypothetical protein